jgi:uncharacterized protein YjbJ (UPF0337 family)
MIRERWGKLTEDDVEEIEGKRERLIGKIQERYGLAKERAERQLEDFLKRIEKQEEAAGHHIF